MEQIPDKINSVSEMVAALKASGTDYETLQKLSASSDEESARISLGLAFTVNSLFYSLLRVQGKCKMLESHPIMDQTNRVKERYMKLQEALQEKDKAKSGRNERSRLDKEATERMIKHAIGSQAEQDRINRAKKHGYIVKTQQSDSDSERLEPDNAEKAGVEKVAKSKAIKKPDYKVKKSQVSMHGATVVPEAAFLRNKKLLEKKKR